MAETTTAMPAEGGATPEFELGGEPRDIVACSDKSSSCYGGYQLRVFADWLDQKPSVQQYSGGALTSLRCVPGTLDPAVLGVSLQLGPIGRVAYFDRASLESGANLLPAFFEPPALPLHKMRFHGFGLHAHVSHERNSHDEDRADVQDVQRSLADGGGGATDAFRRVLARRGGHQWQGHAKSPMRAPTLIAAVSPGVGGGRDEGGACAVWRWKVVTDISDVETRDVVAGDGGGAARPPPPCSRASRCVLVRERLEFANGMVGLFTSGVGRDAAPHEVEAHLRLKLALPSTRRLERCPPA